MTMKVKVNGPIFNNSRENTKIHILWKFGDSSWNPLQVIDPHFQYQAAIMPLLTEQSRGTTPPSKYRLHLNGGNIPKVASSKSQRLVNNKGKATYMTGSSRLPRCFGQLDSVLSVLDWNPSAPHRNTLCIIWHYSVQYIFSRWRFLQYTGPSTKTLSRLC